MKAKDTVTADQIIEGSKKPKGQKIQLFKVRLVKDRSIRMPVTSIAHQDDLVRVAKMELADVPHEELIAIGLDNRNHIIGVVKVSQGGLSSTAIISSDVIRPLIAMGASAFVVAHNHPSGDPTPSRHDHELTANLQRAAACVDLAMYDHIVIGGVRGGGHRSIMGR